MNCRQERASHTQVFTERSAIKAAIPQRAFLESGFALRHLLEVLVHREDAAGFLHAAVVTGRERVVNPVDTLPFRQRRVTALARDVSRRTELLVAMNVARAVHPGLGDRHTHNELGLVIRLDQRIRCLNRGAALQAHAVWDCKIDEQDADLRIGAEVAHR